MRIPTSHRTLIRVAGFSIVAASLALAGCQSRTVSIPSNEPLVTTSPKIGNIGQSQLPSVAAATGKPQVNVAGNSNSWVLRHLNAGKQQASSPVRPASSQVANQGTLVKTAAPAPAKSTSRGLRDVSVAEIPLIDPNHYNPRRVR